MSLETLIVVDTTRKNVLYTREGFGPGKLSFFFQEFWIDPMTELQRHRHPVMDEIFICAEGEMDIVIQQIINGPAALYHLSSNQYTYARQDVLHTLRNKSQKVVHGLAIGIILAENGTTIRE